MAARLGAEPTRRGGLEGGEFLLTTGLGARSRDAARLFRRLAKHGASGLGFGTGFSFAEVPKPIVEEAEDVVPVLAVPYEVPFVAYEDRLHPPRQRAAGARAGRARAPLGGGHPRPRGRRAARRRPCNHLDCSLALVRRAGASGRERHARRRASFDGALELPVVADGEVATLRAARGTGSPSASTTSWSTTANRARLRALAPPRSERGGSRRPAGGHRRRAAGRARPTADDSIRAGAGAKLRGPPRGSAQRPEQQQRSATRSPRSSTAPASAISRLRAATARRCAAARARTRSSGSPRRS